MPQRTAIGRAIIVLSIVILVVVGTLGLVLVTPQSVMKEQTTTTTMTVTSTATPTQLAGSVVGDSFAEHLLLFSSRNVSAIVSQYETNATVQWNGAYCFSGIYAGAGFITLNLNLFLIKYTNLLDIGNVTLMTTTTAANGSVMVNSSFNMVGQSRTYYSNFTSDISAQDTYVYSTTVSAWLISHEIWEFTEFNSAGNVLLVPCGPN
jgi:hypothetical protein